MTIEAPYNLEDFAVYLANESLSHDELMNLYTREYPDERYRHMVYSKIQLQSVDNLTATTNRLNKFAIVLCILSAFIAVAVVAMLLHR